MARLILIALPLWTLGTLYAADWSHRLPAEHDQRRRDKLEFMLSPLQRLPVEYREVVPGQRPGDPPHLFEFIRDGGDYSFAWIPRTRTGYDPTRAGTWLFTFDGNLSRLRSVRVFLGQSPFTYMRLTPERNLFRAEVFFKGERIATRVPILKEARALLTSPLYDLVVATTRHVAWDVVFPLDGSEGALAREMALTARRLLGTGVREATDGALDERGVWRRIATGERLLVPGFNCSGFVKWFADAVFYALGRRYMPLDERLLEKPFEVRGSAYSHALEDARDPFFGLDWTRALAREIRRLRIPGADPDWTGADVTDYPWSLYVSNRGYSIERLTAIAAWLAATRPRNLFLLSVNGDFQPTPADSVLLQHRHTAVLLVWVEEGRTESALFETDGTAARETSLDNLMSRFPQHYVHLVEIPIEKGYRFPRLNLESSF